MGTNPYFLGKDKTLYYMETVGVFFPWDSEDEMKKKCVH